jgi:hypothetical protein
MAAVRVPDILLRVSPKMLERYNALAVAGAGRGRVKPLPYTFTGASARWGIDRDGKLRKYSNDIPRLEFVDTDGNGKRDTAGLVAEGAEANRVIYADDFANWTQVGGTPTRVANTIDLGEIKLSQLGDDDATAGQIEGFRLTGTFSGGGATPFAVVVEKATPSPATATRIQVFDTTAGLMRLEFEITWTGNVPTVTIIGGVGTFHDKEQLGNRDSYRLLLQTTNAVVDTNAWRIDIYPAWGNTDTGTIHIGGVMLGAPGVAATREGTSHIPTAGAVVTRALETPKVPINFGPDVDNLTLFLEFARPRWKTYATTMFPELVSIASNFALDVYCQAAANHEVRAEIRSPSVVNSPLVALPATATIKVCAQFKNLKTTGQCAVDVGTGLSAFSAGTGGATQFGSQELNLGFGSNAGRGHLVLMDVKVLRDLFSWAECDAVP